MVVTRLNCARGMSLQIGNSQVILIDENGLATAARQVRLKAGLHANEALAGLHAKRCTCWIACLSGPGCNVYTMSHTLLLLPGSSNARMSCCMADGWARVDQVQGHAFSRHAAAPLPCHFGPLTCLHSHTLEIKAQNMIIIRKLI